jgi:hypothetical protein
MAMTMTMSQSHILSGYADFKGSAPIRPRRLSPSRCTRTPPLGRSCEYRPSTMPKTRAKKGCWAVPAYSTPGPWVASTIMRSDFRDGGRRGSHKVGVRQDPTHT